LSFYRGATALFGVVFLAIGIALLVRGGGTLAYVIGLLFAALGVGRLYLLRIRR
jgi:hypothetical protein